MTEVTNTPTTITMATINNN